MTTTNKVPVIYKGSDVKFIVRIRDDNDDPVDFTGVTLFTVKMKASPKGNFTVDSNQIPAVAASATSEGVAFTADASGELGNSISLVFNGSDDVDTVVTAWNLANAGNTVSHDGAGTEVPSAGSVDLSGGVEAYYKVETEGNPVLGKIKITLNESDTEQLRLNENPIEIIIDRGAHPAGDRDIVQISRAFKVQASPI
jgi:hypothetical protein